MTYAKSPAAHRALLFPGAATAVLMGAAAFRLAALSDMPPGLSQDEVLNGDVASFILHGYRAFFFREGYGHEPLYHYWAAPFQALLGDNVLSIRLPAVFLGLLLVALTMRWAKREFGSVAAVTAGLGLAVSWWPIIFSRVGIRPVFEPVLLVLMAWFWPRRPWLAGLCLGLSLYTYTGARVVFLIPVFLIIYGLWQGRRWPTPFPLPRTAVIVLLLAVLVSVPLFVTLQADPTLQQRVDQLAGPLEALRHGDIKPVLTSTMATVGVFSFNGDPRWTYTLPGRPLFDAVTAVLFYVGLIVALLRLRQPAYAFALIWLAVGLIPSAITPQAPSTVRLVGALPIVYLLPGIAISFFIEQLAAHENKHRLLTMLRHALPIGLGVLLLFNIMRTVQDGFMRWAAADQTRLVHYQSVLLDMSRYFKTAPTDSLVIADSFYEPIDRDSFRRNLGYDPAARWIQTGAQVSGALVLPMTAQSGNGRLYVPEFAPIPPELLTVSGITEPPLYRSTSWPSFVVYELPSKPALSNSFTPVSFAEMITLQGYKILPQEAEQPLKIVSIWQVQQALPWNLTAFIHLLDKAGNLVAQHDGLDAAAAELQPGDIIIQLHTLPVTNIDGPLTVQIGLYTPDDGQRLKLTGSTADMVILRGNLFIDGR